MNSPKPQFKMLDCFCGMGGVSDGFALEGFDVTGIDVEDAPNKLGYKHRFIQADMTTLDGKDFRGYDVIWGSPPCRDFTDMAKMWGKKWKIPANPENGLKTVNTFLKFKNEAQPKIWIMENNPNLANYTTHKPRNHKSLIGQTMKRSFWGNFPLFLMPSDNGKIKLTSRTKKGAMTHMRINGKIPKNESWERAKISLACSRAFAVACREALEQGVEA